MILVFVMGLRNLFVSTAAMLLLVPNQPAQNTSPASVQRLFPPEAKIIEVANVRIGSSDSRTLVLWMLHGKKVVRQGDLGCSDLLYGDHWYGPTRLSLVDLPHLTLINTVEIRGLYEGSDDDEHGFPIPFYVSKDESYFVPRSDKNGEGTPNILNLQDLTGEGVVGQFALFEYEACGVSLTTVLGYSRNTDTAKQFRVEVVEPGAKTELLTWIPHLFSEKPFQPGHWNITWDPGHGCDCTIHEEVTFDVSRRLFVAKRESHPIPLPPKREGKKQKKV
ncbi:MAG TPA: hypothetical protein VG456_24660 [Candidatus Sulfopaludibacter sp.]|jgi:hypothetical protein|nr:hypothetical protein [Candidatus Sulfopaludibacter sp.]